MIDRKVILYVLAGVIAFALWEAWQKDYNQPIATHQSVTTSAPAAIPSPEGAASTTTKETLASQQASVTKVIPAARLVEVKTDVLDVAIDTAGGNIVRAGLLKYPETLNKTNPVKLLSDDSARYYIAQSGLLSSQGPDSNNKQGQYTSAQPQYKLDPEKDSLQVKLVWSGDGGVNISKIFTFARGKYDIAVDYKIDNQSKQPWSGQFYAQIKRKEFDAKKGLFQFSTYTGAAISSVEKPYEKISFSDIADAAKNKKEFIRDNQGGWVAMQQRYFLSVWVPSQDKIYRYFSNENNGVYTIGLSDGATFVPAGKQATISSVLYVGPEVAENVAPLAKGLDRTADYGWLWVLSIGFFWILKNIYKVVGNWGLAIILVTVLIKAVFYKLSESSCCSMAKMRDLMPKIQALKERYADDKQKLHQATMDLYKQEKVNPLNLGGCLPMLIQIPFFIALYYVLIGAVELRQAPFIFWIRDLSMSDPYYVLPVLMGLSMFLQQRLTPTSADPAQAKMMMFMPVIFTVFFLNFPSGLVLYWFVSNVLSILQQWYINKKLAANAMACKRG